MRTGSLRPFLIGVGIISVGIVGFLILINLRTEPPREETVVVAPLVETVTVSELSGVLTVQGNGSVVAAREVNLSAEVPGRIVSISSNFVSGGRFRTGDVLLSIDGSDYENAVAVADAEVAQRRLELLLAEEESQIARDEWDRLQARDGGTETAPSTELGSLVLREPQVKLAEAVYRGAQARLSDARSRLARTRIVAPFNGRIRTRLAEVGQYVGPGAVVASFYGTDQVEIVVALNAGNAALIDHLFSNRSSDNRIPAIVRAGVGGDDQQWGAYVHRIEGALDPATRTYRVVIRVDAPYRITEERSPLLVGMYVRVEIEGRHLDTYFRIPREALRESDSVWVVEDGKLQMRRVHVVQEIEEIVVVDDGLSNGDQLIISVLPVVADGMSVRVSEGGAL